MGAWHTSITGTVFLLSLTVGAAPCWAETPSSHEPGAADPVKSDSAPTARSFRSNPYGQYPRNPAERMAKDRREIESQRRQRKIEIDALRKVRKADRGAWLKLWEEQRRQAREQSAERERRHHRELNERSPDLAAHRKRHAEELERRRQSFEKERRARWQAFDKLEH